MSGRVRTPRRASGRHFLGSRALAAAIVESAGVAPGELVYDLGAGGGILTAALARRGARVVAVELDPALARGLRARFRSAPDVEIHEADLRAVRWPGEPFRVVANLPFGAGTDALRSLLDDPRVPLLGAELILQWEAAAKRAAVWPSTLLGVVWGAWYELRLVRRLPRRAFAPPPDVDAGVLRAMRREIPLVPAREAAAYRAFVRRGFTGMPLTRLVGGRTLKRLALDLGFDRRARARDLDAVQWSTLYRCASVRSPR